jgi:hypothetical protein
MRLQGGNLGIGVAPTASNGLLQFASGTTKANGIAFGTDAFLFRYAAGIVAIGEGVSGQKTGLRLSNLGTATSSYAAIDFAADGSASGSLFTAADAHSGSYDKLNIGTITNHPFCILTGNVRRIRVGAAGELHFSGGTPVAKPTLPAAATDAATTQALANAIRTALINNGLAA